MLCEPSALVQIILKKIYQGTKKSIPLIKEKNKVAKNKKITTKME